jgi:predicted RecA/RadA family phage recombinase
MVRTLLIVSLTAIIIAAAAAILVGNLVLAGVCVAVAVGSAVAAVVLRLTTNEGTRRS